MFSLVLDDLVIVEVGLQLPWILEFGRGIVHNFDRSTFLHMAVLKGACGFDSFEGSKFSFPQGLSPSQFLQFCQSLEGEFHCEGFLQTIIKLRKIYYE